MKSPRIIIALVLVIVFVVFVGLSAREKYLANPKHANWWSLAFASRDETNNNFSVMSFGKTRTFFYEVETNGNSVETGSFTIGEEGGQTLIVDRNLPHPITISVWTEGDENKASSDTEKHKEIYRK